MGLVIAILLTGMWLYLICKSSIQQIGQLFTGKVVKGKRSQYLIKKYAIIKPFQHLMELLYQMDGVQLQLNAFHMKLLVLKGATWTIESSKEEAAASVANGYVSLVIFIWLSWFSNEKLLMFVGLLLGVGIGLRSFVDAGRKIDQRRKQIIMALPDMLSKLMLLVGAGETVQGAFVRCLDGKEEIEHPLYKEWRSALVSMRNGQSFSTVLEQFNRRCAVQEAAIFTTVMLLNYRKGGEHFVLAVKELSFSLWEKRKAIARTSGEEASSKLVFPLVGILLIMMVIVAAPAILLMA
ncbi:type II secretion system F family protein [Paenibacillus sp. GSMTC-2017]|uniref:type II secretion system F family protein n=1 Tax=Paenibacillus sp. GSMTC-2017 TaxID=2794350 RepID=UPI0018D8E3BC|nr:type II secretion system F family protein [Paenibacillus sp. GSMTC-2017]MBH5317473.1 type II secretion system F family protein [Paenibacillus sp. GSMTC-2017]